MAKPKKVIIAIDQLDLDIANFRLEPADSQDESLENMLEEQQAKLLNLAGDIVENGLSPAESLIVVPNPEIPARFIVCEGNRRLTALRLLQQPRRASGFSFAEEFKLLATEFRKQPITHISCVVFETKEEALKWIERKHSPLNGRGLVQWGAMATERRDEFSSGKVRPSRAILDYLRGANVLPKLLEKGLHHRTTNVDRVFQMPYVRVRLGICIDRNTNNVSFANGDAGAGQALLLDMLRALAAKDVPVGKLLKSEQRTEFIDRFADAAVTASPAPAELQPTDLLTPSVGEFSSKTYRLGENVSPGTTYVDRGSTQKHMRLASPSLNRSTLALRGREYNLAIREPRLNRIYNEARDLDPDLFPNTAAILTRVFLELSSEYFLTHRKVPVPRTANKKHWGDIGLSLELKIKTVLAQLDPSGKEPELHGARQGVSSSEHAHSVVNLHGYIHNRASDIDGEEVKRLWERWQPYFHRLLVTVNAP